MTATKTRCTERVAQPRRFAHIGQCQRIATCDDGTKCKQHSEKYVAERRAKSEADHKAAEAQRLHSSMLYYGKPLISALREIVALSYGTKAGAVAIKVLTDNKIALTETKT